MYMWFTIISNSSLSVILPYMTININTSTNHPGYLHARSKTSEPFIICHYYCHVINKVFMETSTDSDNKHNITLELNGFMSTKMAVMSESNGIR